MRRLLSPSLALILLACSSDDPAPAPPPAPAAIAGAQVRFDLGSELSTPETFFQFPYPSDLRLVDGSPDVRGWPNPRNLGLVEALRVAAAERKGFPVLPAAYFLFDAPLAERTPDAVLPAAKDAPVMLVDIDPASPEKGRLYPMVASTLPPDDYTPENLLAVAPRPGFVLAPNRTYAFVVLRSLGDASGAPLGVPQAMEELKAGVTPAGARGKAAAEQYAKLWPVLKQIGVDTAQVAAATVFSTVDVVSDLFELTNKLKAQYKVEITGLAVDPGDGAKHPRYCELRGKVVYPQFQKGTPPFNKEGLFDFSQGDLPVKQRDEEAPITLTLPKGPMPEGGYPLAMFFHGSGGLSTAVVDRGTWRNTEDPADCPPWPDTLRCDKKKSDPQTLLDEWEKKRGCNTAGEGPAHVMAQRGFAMAASALPLNPERLECAEEIAYLNFNNLAAFRDTFRQGVIEQRLFIEALSTLTIDPAIVASCEGLSLPAGASAYRFSLDKLVATGQSMGGMYTNMIGAVEPRIQAVAPTGAGGFWSYFILKTKLLANIDKAVGSLLVTKAPLQFLHPALQLLETAWEPAEPLAYMPRLGKNPLPNHPARAIYEPVGKDDSYFPIELFDAVALAYGHPQAGQEVWPSMQQALSLDDRGGLLPYPVVDNNDSLAGGKFTGAVIQYPGDGVYDPHALYSQRDEVKYQYGCFFESLLKKGKASIPAPAPVDSPCP
jgi:hypothetical protein